MSRYRAPFVAALVLTLISGAAHAQTSSTPKTPWGDPDLQGVWSGDSAFGIPVLPYECHEGNLAILQGLGGERAEDKAVEEDAKKGIIRARRPIQGGLTVGGQPIPESGPPASNP